MSYNRYWLRDDLTLDVETHSCEDDQFDDKVKELQVENQNLKSEKIDVERQFEDKVKKFEELQVENQNLKAEKNCMERQFEDKVKELQVENQNLKSEKIYVERQFEDKVNLAEAIGRTTSAG